jgi:Divergent InlB B-repeat domain/Bacterial Ig-like domain (group 2)
MTGRNAVVCSTILALLALVFLVGCGSNAELTSISVTPATSSVQNAGGTVQFEATGTYTNGKNGVIYTQNQTNQVNWGSSTPGVATIDSAGLATTVGKGTTTITATGGNGGIVGTATLTVLNNAQSLTLKSITILRSTSAVQSAGETAQYIAIGNYIGETATRDITNEVAWSSSNARIATINSSGLATAIGACPQSGQTTIGAVARTPQGQVVSAKTDLSVAYCGPEKQPTLTVYKVGQGSGTITSSNAGISCHSGSGCTANFAVNTPVTLTAIAEPGSVFVGWTANCRPSESSTCTMTMVNNATVGAIFKSIE